MELVQSNQLCKCYLCAHLLRMRLALACAALLLTLSCAQHVSFREMSSNGKATGVKFDTGYEERVLQYICNTNLGSAVALPLGAA